MPTRQVQVRNKVHGPLGQVSVRIFVANDRINQVLIEHLDPAAWNAKPPGNTRSGAEALSVAEEVFHVDGMELQVLRTEVTTRQAFVLAPTLGKTVTTYEPEGKAAAEIRGLAEELAKCLQTNAVA